MSIKRGHICILTNHDYLSNELIRELHPGDEIGLLVLKVTDTNTALVVPVFMNQKCGTISVNIDGRHYYARFKGFCSVDILRLRRDYSFKSNYEAVSAIYAAHNSFVKRMAEIVRKKKIMVIQEKRDQKELLRLRSFENETRTMMKIPDYVRKQMLNPFQGGLCCPR